MAAMQSPGCVAADKIMGLEDLPLPFPAFVGVGELHGPLCSSPEVQKLEKNIMTHFWIAILKPEVGCDLFFSPWGSPTSTAPLS